MRALNTIWI